MAEIDYTQYGHVPEKDKELDYSQYGAQPVQNEKPMTAQSAPSALSKLKPGVDPDLILNDRNLLRSGKIAGSDILKMIGNAIKLTGNQGPSAVKETFTHPSDSLQHAAYGMIKGGENIANIPRNIPGLLGHLELANPRIMSSINEALPRFDFAKYAKPKGEMRRGQELIEKLMENAIPIAQGAKLIKPGLAKVASTGNPQLKQFAKASEENLIGHKATLEEAANAHQAQLEKQNKAIYEAEEETGKGTKPSTMKHSIGKDVIKTQEQEEKLAELNKQLEEHQNLPELPEVDTASHEKNVSNAEKSLANIDKHIEDVNATHQNAESNLGNVDKNISKFLNVKAAHDVRAASQIKDAAEGARKELSKSYDSLKENMKENHVVIDNTPLIQDLNTKLIEMMKENKMHTKEFDNLNNEVFKLQNERTIIPANDYLSMLKSAKQYARDAREKAFKPDMNEEERAMWHKRYNELDEMIEKMDANFESSVPQEYIDKLKETNAGWRDIVKPLQRNNTYQTIKHRGRIEGDIMNKLRGTDQGDVIMKNIIKGNPEILKNVVGQRYAEKPHELQNAGELENEYINQLPELKNMVSERSTHEGNLNQAKENIKNAVLRKKEIEAQHKKAVSEKAKAEKEKTKLESAKTARSEKEKKIKEDIEGHKKDIAKLNDQIEKSKKHLKILEKEMSETKITKEALAQAKKNVQIEKERISKLNKDLQESKGLLVKGYQIARGLARLTMKVKRMGS